MDVLSRLPAKTLLGLKCVSKDWHRLISERSFIRHQLQRAEPVSGFFFQERFQWCDDDIKAISYIPVKMEGTEVQPSVFNFLPESVVLSAVSNGLICCQSCLPSPKPVIYVCNPLKKEWVTFPWSAPDKRSSLGLAFDPFKDPIDKSTDFKVVTVHQTASDMEVEDEDRDSYLTTKAFFVGGALYWLTDGDQILMFNVQNELSWLVTVPIPLVQFDSIREMCIGESEGKLHYVLISEGGLHVWVLEDYLDFTWALKYSIALNAMEKENTFKDGLLFMRVTARIYSFNFETRKLEELCTLSMLGPNSMISPIVLPHSMSLFPLG
ncbi:hypothetical protein Acr_19g0005690 [Actinidia rufa]|uniref:F-box domain-containing protein n=1 Tax=Actinidia rufa TaxID=165716 RepID=A0A7J0GA69_9ERIC|nr:hypothetical protein Acr_19g0005690 [Actinidia rufa]